MTGVASLSPHANLHHRSPTMDYSDEPPKSDMLIVQGTEPFNAEPAASALVEFDITPIDLVYCRNHGPVREFDEDSYTIVVKGVQDSELKFTMNDIRSKFNKAEVIAALQVSISQYMTLIQAVYSYTSVRRK